MFFRPKLGLVLGGGGARGGAHVGVVRVLSEVGYKPDIIVGTSSGGVVAVMLGAGWSPDQVERYFSQADFSKLLYLVREGNSLMGNERLRTELERLFGNADLRDLSPKVAVMAADIRNSQRILIERGPIVEAVLASAALPGLLPPIPWGECLLADGGITDNVPVQAAYQLGAQRVVAVDLGANSETGFEVDEGHGFSKYLQGTLHWLLGLGRRQTAFDIFVHSQLLSSEMLVDYHLALFPPDVLIRPNMPGIGLFSFEKIPVAIRAGEQAAQQVYPQLRALAHSLLLPRKPRKPPTLQIAMPPDF